jgi:hypothetical protein
VTDHPCSMGMTAREDESARRRGAVRATCLARTQRTSGAGIRDQSHSPWVSPDCRAHRRSARRDAYGSGAPQSTFADRLGISPTGVSSAAVERATVAPPESAITEQGGG